MLPQSATAAARRTLGTRALRGFADGAVGVVLPAYLVGLGYSGTRIGVITTATLVGSALTVTALGLWASQLDLRPLLSLTALLMIGTGIAFATIQTFAALFVVSVIGTLNPSSADVSAFLPLEQTLCREPGC